MRYVQFVLFRFRALRFLVKLADLTEFEGGLLETVSNNLCQCSSKPTTISLNMSIGDKLFL